MRDKDESANAPADSVFHPGQTDWIKGKAAEELDEDQRALLLALARLEAEIGRDLSDDERSAIEALGSQLEGFDASAIEDAIHQMVNQPADPHRKTSWSELKDHLG
ncbi:MAG: hypothetical protein JXC32_17725 [Anaerolineae bacterium]|nr:hypothetical protein [Anaerolineae bacterium]